MTWKSYSFKNMVHQNKCAFSKKLLLTYCFVYRLDYNAVIHKTSVNYGNSDADSYTDTRKHILETLTRTVMDDYSYCREMHSYIVEKGVKKIRGQGKTVEINQDKSITMETMVD